MLISNIKVNFSSLFLCKLFQKAVGRTIELFFLEYFFTDVFQVLPFFYFFNFGFYLIEYRNGIISIKTLFIFQTMEGD